MNIAKLLIVGFLLVMVLLAGCTTGGYSAPRAPSGPVGGGCGVGAPAPEADSPAAASVDAESLGA
ncbi:hypothetical protein HY642_03180 [Candidatus Woesearchaeota archaeon]|nr:hypothetical protein [Candidatus Woesearchaeota archaeon]